LEPYPHQKNEPLITLERVTLRRGDRTLLAGTSWEIRSQENWAILGPNGSGKSALAGAIRGDVPHVRGKLIRHDPEAAGSRIGYLSFELQEEFLAREERRDEARAFSGRGHALTAGELLRENDGDPAALDRVVADLGIRPLLGQGFRTLSNGEIRKLLIARALLPAPRLLILDDPFAGLDADSRRSLAEAISTLMDRGTQILLVAQRPEEMMQGISHVLLIRNGRVAAAGPREEVLTPGRMRRFGKQEALRPLSLPAPAGRKAASTLPGDLLVEMKDIHVAYGDCVVLDGLNWTVRRGENWAVVGPNGSGKSTLLSLITGDNLQVYANEVRLFGKRRGEGESVWTVRQRIGVVSPELQLRYRKPGTVREVALSGFFDSIGLYRQPDSDQEALADRWLGSLSLTDRAQRPYAHLSYGEKRLVLIVRAMVKSPELLILDEPCQGLDGANRTRVLSLMEEIGNRGDTSLIYVTHHEEEMIPCIGHVLRLVKTQRRTADRQSPPEEEADEKP
jgi:molybdate transport system ATP-binding protein